MQKTKFGSLLTFDVVGQLLVGVGQSLAVPTPMGVELDEPGIWCVPNSLVEVTGGQLDDGVRGLVEGGRRGGR